MRKIKSFPKYLKTQKRKQRRSLLVARRRKDEPHFQKNKTARRIDVLSKGLGLETVRAPANFSFVNNVEEMIAFIDELKRIVFFQNRSVIVDLTGIQQVTNDALILMLSVAQDKRVKKNVKVHVRHPQDSEIADRLKESGISEQYEGLEAVMPAKYGRIRQKSSFQADTEKANELIAFATRQLFGRKRALRDVQRILSECVDNTTSHASGKSDKKLAEMWWGTVFCDIKKNIAYFSVLDNGVGIIDSLKAEWFNQIKLLTKFRSNDDLLKGVFEGGVLSSTGQSNRGNGLPGIFKARKRQQFLRLIVVTNNVYIDFDHGDYLLLNGSFSGTFFYWEVRRDNNGKDG